MSDKIEDTAQPDDKGLADGRLHPLCSALADLCISLTKRKDRYIGYKLQSEKQGNFEWAARYGDIADAYEHSIIQIKTLIRTPNVSDQATASEKR